MVRSNRPESMVEFMPSPLLESLLGKCLRTQDKSSAGRRNSCSCFSFTACSKYTRPPSHGLRHLLSWKGLRISYEVYLTIQSLSCRYSSILITLARVNLQHFLFKESFDYNLHPDIPVDKPDLKIADIGTGTGYAYPLPTLGSHNSCTRIWLFGLAKQFPLSTQLDGFDISKNQFTHDKWCPINMTFRVLNALEDPPEELQGQYDIVHIRFFLIVVENNDPAPLISHCLKLLSMLIQ